MSLLPLSPQVFAILASLIEERSGLHYALTELELVAERVSSRAAERGFESLLDYYYFLRYDPGGPAELDALIEGLVVHETYFFRESPALETLCDALLAPLLAAGARPRVWCAACATGEEPLTLAMMLDDRGVLGRVELVATDISARAVERARRGQVNGRALRALPDGILGRHVSHEGGRVVVPPRLLESITWDRVNLIDGMAVVALGTFDAILCRNVLIYFSDAVAGQVVARLGDALRPGGALFVGVSESLLRLGTSLAGEERGGTFLYRKVP